jgi:hypothetical protein
MGRVDGSNILRKECILSESSKYFKNIGRLNYMDRKTADIRIADVETIILQTGASANNSLPALGTDSPSHMQLTNIIALFCTYSLYPVTSNYMIFVKLPVSSIRLTSKLPQRLLYNDSLISQSVLRQVHSLFQSEFYTQCGLVFPLSTSSTPLFP